MGSGLYAQDSSEDLQKVCMLITNYHQLHDCEYHSMMIVHDHKNYPHSLFSVQMHCTLKKYSRKWPRRLPKTLLISTKAF